MNVQRVICAWFSPTGNVEALALAMGESLAAELEAPMERLNLTRPEHRTPRAFGPGDLLVIGLPVYAGRLPNKLVPELRGLRGDGTRSVCFVAYGNRAFDDALSELVLEQRQSGFLPVAAAAFPTEHAFAPGLASGRPDAEDLARAAEFAAAAARLEPGELTVPGRTPPGPYYRPLRLDGQPASFLKATPRVDAARCTGCGACDAVCPMGSVKGSETVGICIKCQACIHRCPRQARWFDDPDFLSHRAMLEQTCTARQEIFFAAAKQPEG